MPSLIIFAILCPTLQVFVSRPFQVFFVEPPVTDTFAEAVFFHLETRTLLVTDCALKLPPTAPKILESYGYDGTPGPISLDQWRQAKTLERVRAWVLRAHVEWYLFGLHHVASPFYSFLMPQLSTMLQPQIQSDRLRLRHWSKSGREGPPLAVSSIKWS